MLRMTLALAAFFATGWPVDRAAAVEIAWKGGATVTATSGCTGWNPLGEHFQAYYFFPLAGTTNGTDSTLSLHATGSEAFQASGRFTTAFKAVRTTHIYTRAGQYDSQLRILSITPATVTATTPFITASVQINKFENWDGKSKCLLTLNMALTRSIDN